MSRPDPIVPIVEIKLIAEKYPDSYIVGGAVRDLLLGKVSRDIDLVIPGNLPKAAKELASVFLAPYFVLDSERQVFRIVLQKTHEWYLDLSPLRGDIKSDLLKRDFSVDAMAVPIAEWPSPRHYLDPTGGVKDLKEKTIRMICPEVFQDDPLRLYRAFRIASRIEGNIDPGTLSEIKKNVSLISSVAGERIKDELFFILAHPHSAGRLDDIYSAGLFDATFSEFAAFGDRNDNYYHKGGLWEHSLETLRKFEEKVLAGNFERFAEFRSDLDKYFDRHTIILTKLGCLLHDIGKAEAASRVSGRLRFFGHERIGSFLARNIMRKLKSSRSDMKFVSDVVYHHMRPSNMSARSTERAFYRFFRSFASSAHLAAVFTAFCDRYSYETAPGRFAEMVNQENFTEKILRVYFREKKINRPPLLNGNDVMEALGIPPGPLVGRIIEAVEEARAAEKIKTKEEAMVYAEEIKDSVPLMDVSVIVPAYNEEATIGEVLDKLKNLPASWELLVIDDGSADKTAEIASRYKVRLLRNETNKGKGAALRAGIASARGKYIAVQDADTEYDSLQLKALAEYALKEDVDAVYGSRFLRKNPVRYINFFLGNYFVSAFISAIFLSRVTDAYTCYKVVRSELLKSFNLRSGGFEIESEITSRLLKNGVKIIEMPISYEPRSKEEGKKIRPLDGIKALIEALRVRFS
ncbi:glycosyltransferase [bacterium]|nr:glycosyltransferase [Candidatus Omnitrophota bacterium]MBU2528050.1 glycosyltransferase [bacterium]MBU3929737.1 glycosyltransferase [bacterium]MBU4123560.1 glycosyltransferase [bacterium]